MKKTLTVVLGLLLAGCAGYQPLYQKVQSGKISVNRVYMTNVEQNQGTRRPAQIVQQELARHYPEGDGGEYSFDVALSESYDTLAVRKDAIDQRKQMRLAGTITFYDAQRRLVHTSSITKYSPFNVDDKPLSTEASMSSAREVTARAFADEVVRRVALFLGDGRK